jgi:DNA-binding MarR family transcriptional regulator
VPVVDGLVDRGLIGREVDPADRRRRVLTLTDGGRTVVGDLIETGTEIEERFLRALKPAERTQLRRVLLALRTDNG